MNFLVALLTSFMAVAAANPVGDIGGRAATLEARIDPKHCDILPFLLCDGGIDQEIATVCVRDSLPVNMDTIVEIPDIVEWEH
ncbi:hypothetical protein C8J57DRAFT_1529379 [Mycena rebaudengoi]|nr:hypothetical protein C8J57DRAFT_1529379 [Mycena rebaudengoi]